MILSSCGARKERNAHTPEAVKAKKPKHIVTLSFDDGFKKSSIRTAEIPNVHIAGGVPCLALEMARLDATNLGGLLYLFEKAVAVSGRLLGVNPFDQPGVEAYKSEMFRLLGKPKT